MENEIKEWQKVLYLDQGVPDNYVDVTFMKDLKKNLYTKTYDYWFVVKESGVLTHQICSVCIFITVFIYMDSMLLSPQILFCISFVTNILGYALKCIYFNDGLKNNYYHDLRISVISLGFCFFLSPILMTLTQSISTDTIYAMTFFMFLCNLMFHDYGTKSVIVSRSISLNSAIFASVCLASRLSTAWHTFSMLTFALQMFALWPSFRTIFKKNTKDRAFVCMTVLTSLLSFIGVASISYIASIQYLLLHIFITFLCPALFVHMQSYKNNIHGPWEEAVINLKK
ncbi:hypothetical protein HELRODRAFT_78116 [Helobdella robusta]|uniref:Phosphatidylinositol N-acetylglucosaminyltransferase subunit C n=1 Tax=Helobdella robusta TaxID=6412 RepID=T1G382_HELRO|nr:hypothetical protein HELRODRAFT_78116 [Helobdella robusta]ESO05070.1 hypothetical protein HELRODRAFT_78116 [Helobdella robusta]